MSEANTGSLRPLPLTAQRIVAHYFKQWDIELVTRDIKITTGLDFIRAKSVEMAGKVYGFGIIAYNLIRWQLRRACVGSNRRPLSNQPGPPQES
ncbi:MAG: hypothetical protein ACFCU4_05795 [Puniceicoccaceae bacterium]